MIGKRLTLLRKARGLTQEELAARINIPRSTYSNYESGKREPDFNTTKDLANFFDVSIDYLIGDKKMEYKSTEDKKAKTVFELTSKYGFNAEDPESMELLEELLKLGKKLKKS